MRNVKGMNVWEYFSRISSSEFNYCQSSVRKRPPMTSHILRYISCTSLNLVLILIDALPQFVRINYLPLRDRIIILVNIPSSHGEQAGGEEQQEEDCAASEIESSGSCELSVNYLGNDDETSSGKSESKVSVDYKDT